MITTTVDLLRHGEPVGGSKYRGQIDDPLSERGWRQLRTAVGDHCPWDLVISSPLSRCHDFARELTQRHGLPLEVDAGFMEIGFGEWEGYTADELLQRDPEILMRFWSDPEQHTPPGAERLTDFRKRIVTAWEQAITTHAGKHILIIGHAGMMRMILLHVLAIPMANLFRIKVPNAGISRICIDNNGAQSLPRLLFHAGQL